MTTSNHTNLRAAIIGFGRNGESMHAKPLKASPDFDLVAVSDLNPERKPVAETVYGSRFYTDYRKMIAQEKPDVVSIVTRSDQHVEMACCCMELGCNVMVTKPWALNAEEAEKMLKTANRLGRRVLPWLPARWAPDQVLARELIDAGTIGEVFFIERRVCMFSRRDDWQMQAKYGGGYLLNWGAHIIEPTYRVLNTQVERVAYAELRNVIHASDAEDHFHAVLKLKNGVTAIAEHSIQAVPLNQWIIRGDRGSIFINDNEVEIHCLGNEKPMPIGKPKVFRREEQLEGALYGDVNRIYADLALELRGQCLLNFETDTALKLTKVMDAVRRSALNATQVEL